MELFSKTSLAVGSTDDVPGCDRTPKMGTRGNKLRQDKKKGKRVGLGALGLGVDRLIQ